MDIAVKMIGVGGPDQLTVAPDEPKTPGPTEIRIRHEAIGVNYIDIYHRSGLYPLGPLPAVLGVEGAGVIEAVGSGVTALRVGQRVAYAGAPVGAYASTRLLPAVRAIGLPDDVSASAAASSLVRGITAHMLLTKTFPVGAGNVILVHAAAGGLGTMLARWAKALGASVIGTVSTPEKAEFAKLNGVDHVIVGRDVDLAREVADVTDGRGVDVAYDGIGGTTLLKTLACVRPFGTVASIGQAGGPIAPISVEELGPRRSLSLARPSVMAYSADPSLYRSAAKAVLEAMRSGLSATIGETYPLAEAARAQAELEAGATTGSSLLIP